MLSSADALALARSLAHASPLASRGRFEADDFDDATFVVRVDAHHLDADAMSDRLHAWIEREVRVVLPAASANVSFLHARPATSDAPDLDEEAHWLGVEPTLKLDVHAGVTREDVQRWVALLPRFLELVAGRGRPEGYRPDVSAGSME